jgi:DNA-binding NarL/FixJ family response regulator
LRSHSRISPQFRRTAGRAVANREIRVFERIGPYGVRLRVLVRTGAAMTTARLLLVDDHNLVRAGLRSLIEGMPDIEVVGEAANAEEALAGIAALAPDIVVTDISMSGLSGIELAAKLKQEYPDIRVLVLSVHAEAEFVRQALAAGACGYLIKDAATKELELAIHAALRGQVYLSPAISKGVVDGYLQHSSSSPLDPLTPRQREVLKLISEGLGTKAIAFQLGVSVKTVETHRAQLMDRLDIHDVPGLVRFAVRSGLVSADV